MSRLYYRKFNVSSGDSNNMSNMRAKNDGKIRDVDIRLAFIARNMGFFEQPGFEFVNEFGINSTNIIDLAAFDFNHKNDEGKEDPIFYGFEIKSEQDNVNRLYKQLNAYITFFQIIYVIVHEKLTPEVLEILDKNKQFSKIGVIEVSQELEFKQIRQAKRYRPFYTLFIQNLDLEELRIMAAAHKLPLNCSKQVLLSKVRRYVTLEEVYAGIKNKLYKYFVWQCPLCGSKLYYNQNNRGGRVHICYKCKHKTYF